MARKISRSELARHLLAYFEGHDGEVPTRAEGEIPSFIKFARREGLQLGELEAQLSRGVLSEVRRTCEALRREHLIDRALLRRYDPSFVKYLLEAEQTAVEGDGTLAVQIEVVP